MIRFLLSVFLLVTLSRGEAYCDENFYFGIFRNAASSTPFSNTTLTTLLITLQDNTTSSHITIETRQGIFHSLTLTPLNISTEIILPDYLTVSNGFDRHKGIYVHSTNSVSITVLSQNNNSSDAYQIYPTPNTNMYNLAVYYAITPGVNTHYYSQVLLVATQDNSTITISPTKDVNISSDLQDLSNNSITVVVPAGSTYTGTLHRFQTLSFESINDLTGSRITSSQPLVVISGHECAQFDSNSSSLSCSFIAEQIPPANVWGTSFIASPLSLNTTQNYIILSSVNDTIITQTCTNNDSSLLISLSEVGQSYQLTTTNQQTVFCSIESNFPILVVSIYIEERPLMVLIPPVEQYRSNIILSSFSCTLNTQAMLLFNSTSIQDITFNDSFISSVPPSGSVLYLSFENDFDYRYQEESSAIVYNLATGCRFAYTMGWRNLTQNITIPPNITTTYSFGTPSYHVLESRGTAEITIIKSNNLNEQTSVRVVTTSSSQTNETSSNNDFIILNELIVFDVGETRNTIRVNITDDELVEPRESFTISLISNNTIITSGQFVLTIIDDDSLIVGLNRIVYESNTQLLSIEVGVNLGLLAPDIKFGLIIKLLPQEWILLDQVIFTHETIAHVVKVNLTRTNLCNNQSASECILSSEISLEMIGTLNITLSPQNLNGTLESFIQVNQQTCQYIIGEFTQQSLLISACVTGVLLIITLLAIVIGVAGFGLSYHTRRKWTLGGGLNRLYFQDDAMSLATNDPESYELMNRLGEKQTATLAINDDNEY